MPAAVLGAPGGDVLGDVSLAREAAGQLVTALRNETVLSDLLKATVNQLVAPTPASWGRPLRDVARGIETRRVGFAELAERLERDRYAVLDGAVPARLIASAGAEARALDRLRWLGSETRLGVLRGDRHRMVVAARDRRSLPSLTSVLDRMVGAAARLSTRGVLGARPGELIADPHGGMVACYDAGARYARHTDREPDGNNEIRRRLVSGENMRMFNENRPRHLTTIVYLPEVGTWEPRHGGELRLWPRGGGNRTTLDPVLGSARLSGASHADTDADAVDVEPLGGRLVIFESQLVHEVRPVGADNSRCALTLWVHNRSKYEAHAQEEL